MAGCCPGLVNVRTHPGAEQPGDPFDESVLRTDLAEHAAAGVLLVRAPGSAARIPGWAHDADGLPRVRSAGPWLATPGRFFPFWGRHVTEAELRAAAEEAAAPEAAARRPGPGAGPGNGLGPPGGRLPARLRGRGGLVQDHRRLGLGRAAGPAGGSPWRDQRGARDRREGVRALPDRPGCAHAVAAGVDSLEHGMHLDPGLLDQMAAQGTALVPTLNAFAHPRSGSGLDPGPRRDSFLAGWAAMPASERAAAYEAGVTVLSGTDTHPCGTVAEEVERLIGAGLPRTAAVGSASWAARACSACRG